MTQSRKVLMRLISLTWLFPVFVVVILSTAFLANAADLHLGAEDLPKLLAERNQTIKGASMLEDAAKARTGHLARSFLPTLALELGGENFQTGPYVSSTQPYGFAEARLNLFRGGKDALEEGIREEQVLAFSAEARRLIAAELAETRKSYWTLVFQRELVTALKESLEQNNRNLQAASRRIQRGLTTATDRLDFEINRDQIQEEIRSLEHENELEQIKLRAILSLPDDTVFKTLEKIPHLHDDAFMTLKLDSDSQFEVTGLRASESIARRESSIAGRWWTPSIDVYGGYYLYTLRDRDYLVRDLRDDQAVGIRLSFTLFDGLESHALASAAGLRSGAFEHQAIQRGRMVKARFKVSQEEMKHLHELVHESERRIEQGRDYLARTLAEYDRGVKNSPDVLGALQRATSFRRRSAEIRRDYQLVKAAALEVAGQ